jgi:ribose 1,5-bisphosphokinase
MLVLVVGPSGAGKDTLLDAARARLAGDDRFLFVRRAITRPADAGGEAHEALTSAEFAERRSGFALSWQAHGLSYGISAAIEGELAKGRVVIANVSRSVIQEAATRFAARLGQRGREDQADIASRLTRSVTLPANVPTESVMNDATPEQGIARFLAALNRAAEAARRA